jgi:large subunit ribosomal protein L32e
MTDLKTKKDMKKRLPKFSAQDSHKKAKISGRWRKPRGSDSKMRKQLKGYRKVVKQGYMTPSKLKDIHIKTGLKSVLIENIEGIKKVDPKINCAIIKKSIGTLKRVNIVKKCLEKNIIIINFDAKKFIEKYEKDQQKKKELKEKKKKAKEKKEKELKKKADEKKKEDKKEDISDKLQTDEEKKEQEKKDKDKLLIQTE